MGWKFRFRDSPPDCDGEMGRSRIRKTFRQVYAIRSLPGGECDLIPELTYAKRSEFAVGWAKEVRKRAVNQFDENSPSRFNFRGLKAKEKIQFLKPRRKKQVALKRKPSVEKICLTYENLEYCIREIQLQIRE